MTSSKRPSGQEPTELTELAAFGMDLAPGTMVGEYRVEQRIGEGAMGVVYAAVHPMIGKRAAIKVLQDELSSNQFAIERFIDEARVVNQIGHPNIVDVFAFGQLANGQHYFVMEWLQGASLRERLARARMSRAEVCGYVRPLARALMAAHAKGIVHRDLKPDNVFLVEEDGEATVKLLDFGIAKLARTEHRQEQTATGVVVGTPMYIAPEQAKGLAIDARADVYSLGAMMFEMLTGRIPFIANSALEVIAMHLMEAPPRVSSLAPEVPRELDDLVIAMMAKDPAARPQLATVCEIVDRAKHAPAGMVTERPRPSINVIHAAPVVPHTMPPTAPQPRRSLRWVLLLLSAVLAAVLAYVVVKTVVPRDDAAPKTEVVPMQPTSEPVPPPVAPPPVAPPPSVAPVIAPTPIPITPTPAVAPKPPTPAAPTPKPSTAPAKPPHHKVEKPKDDPNELLFDPGSLPKSGKK